MCPGGDVNSFYLAAKDSRIRQPSLTSDHTNFEIVLIYKILQKSRLILNCEIKKFKKDNYCLMYCTFIN